MIAVTSILLLLSTTGVVAPPALTTGQPPPAITNDAFAQISERSNVTSNNANATAGAERENVTDTHLYSCELFSKTIHCEPILSHFESHLLEADSERIYTVTKDSEDILYAEGIVNGSKSLQFRAYFGEFVNIENNPKINPSEFSVSFWAKRSSDPGFYNYGNVISHINAAASAGWLFDVGNSTSQSIRFGVTNGNGTLFYAGEVPVNSYTFTHIVGTFNGSSVRVYGNGLLLDSVPFSGVYEQDPGVPLRLAMSSHNHAFPWEGTMDEVRIYNKSLTEEEVRSIFLSAKKHYGVSSSNSPSVSEDALVGHWPFDGDIIDVSSNNNPTRYIIQTAGMAFTPDGRLLFTEKNTGKVRILMTPQNNTVLEEPFAVVPDFHYDMEQGLLGITVDPEFGENRYVYAYYTAREGNNDTILFNRVVRFTDVNNTGANMTVIIDKIPAHRGGMHAGGAIAFGPHDGKLYITVGNAYLPEEAQDSASLLGKVLRINKDGTIPEDNPFPDSPVYTTGHRNSYGIAFDTVGNGIVTENGDDLYDEINLVVKGGNYGYPTMQLPNRSPIGGTDGSSSSSASIKPVRIYWKTVAPTQAIYYDGTKFPDLAGKFLVGSYNNGRLYALEINQDNKTVSQELKIQFPYRIQSNIIAVAQSPVTGDIYYGGYHIHRLHSIDSNSREPIIAIIRITSNDAEVIDLRFDVNNKMITIKVQPTAEISTSDSLALNVEIPKLLLDGISSVSINSNAVGGNPARVQSSVSTASDHNVVTITTAMPAVIDDQLISLSIVGNTTRFGVD